MPLRTATWAAPAWWPRGTMRTLPLLDRRELLRLGACLGAAVHKCGQRAVAKPPAIAVAALVDVVAGQVDADVGAVSRQYASLDLLQHSPNECAGLKPPKRQKSSTARCSASPSSMRKDRERVRHRYHGPRAHKRARARRNGWPSSPRMPHNGRETPEVRRHDALSTGLVKTYFVEEK